MSKKTDKLLTTEQVVEAITATDRAAKVYKSNVLLKTLFIILCSITLVFLLVFGAIGLIGQNGQFTVNIKQVTSKGLSLALTEDFADPASRLSFDCPDSMTNISKNSIPADVDTIDGEHSKDNYLAFTFYIKNVGTENTDVEYSLNVKNVVKGADEAVHIRIITDGVSTDYAKMASDGSPEPGTTAFISGETVINGTFHLDSEAIKKYTVVIWLEGDDPECIDNIKGGFVSFDMNFQIVE